jgi:hypothetical protein
VGPEAHLKFSFPTKTHNGYEVHHKKQETREAQPITVTKLLQEAGDKGGSRAWGGEQGATQRRRA